MWGGEEILKVEVPNISNQSYLITVRNTRIIGMTSTVSELIVDSGVMLSTAE